MGEVHHIRPEATGFQADKFKKELERIQRQTTISRSLFYCGIALAASGLGGHYAGIPAAIWPFCIGLAIALIGSVIMPGHGAFRAAWENSFRQDEQ